jgi:membrane protein implicated in regulation of membrane protease activity
MRHRASLMRRRFPGQSTVVQTGAMQMNNTVRILLIYVLCMFAGQAAAVGVGLALDSYSTTLALSVFIPLYYAMYWVAWRFALFIGDRSDASASDSAGKDGGSRAKAATWLLAPAVLALDLAD